MLKGMFTATENKMMFWREYIKQCVDIGIGSLPIVVIISFFLGAVMTVQTAAQLVSPLIPLSTVGIIVRDGMLLEFAPTILSIVLAGVVGSKISSELGNMRVSEQIDALEIMGINTKAFLILPKILASFIVVPLLVIYSGVLSILGGRFAGTMANILSAETFDKGLLINFNPYNVTFSLIKAYTFSFIISGISSYYGYHVKGGALEIGQASTKAVVTSCIAILLADYALASLLL